MAVRELCEFTAKSGDLDLRFTPAPSAQEGMAGHALVVSRRGAGYQAELRLSGVYKSLRVSGRADGYDPQRRRLEEIKTFKGRLERQPESHRRLHWAQAKVYAWLLCEQEGLDALEVALVYLDIGSQQETVFSEHCSAQELKLHFEASASASSAGPSSSWRTEISAMRRCARWVSPLASSAPASGRSRKASTRLR